MNRAPSRPGGRRRWPWSRYVTPRNPSVEERPEIVADDEPGVLVTVTGTVQTLRRADGDRQAEWSAAWLKEGESGRWGRSSDGNDAAVYSKGAAWRRPAVEEATLEDQGWTREEGGK